MKKRLSIFAVLIILIGFASCSKSDDTKITGRWQLQSALYPTHETITDSVFYSFDRGIFALQTLQSGNLYAESTVGEYSLQGDSIIMKVAPSYTERARNSIYYDWKTAERRFALRTLTDKTLVFSVKDTVYTFRKYH
ncbi:MAG: lipocalin-like domain-containing protein [Bacteroidales bacterium]